MRHGGHSVISIQPVATMSPQIRYMASTPSMTLCVAVAIDVSHIPRTYRRVLKKDVAATMSLVAELSTAPDGVIAHRALKLRSTVDTTKSGWMVEPLALAAIAAHRTLGLQPYDVQVLGAAMLTYSTLAEVRTGEGKTLIAALASTAFSLAGKDVHVMTANEYLARRDAEWMSPVYEFFSMSAGCIDDHPSRWRRQTAYAAEVCYGTASQFGFDYLNDHLITDPSQRCQRSHTVALVDEADALLLDDARTPLIISGPPADSSSIDKVTDFVRRLDPDAVEVDRETRNAFLTDAGFDQADVEFGRDITSDPLIMADIYAALRAHFCYERDKDYLVVDDSIAIIDESTGRIQNDRRWQHGLHEALEAKEGVPVRLPAATLGSTTLPAYLSLYEHVAAMSGTALSDADEFESTYGLMVLPVPTHRPIARVDADDVLFATRDAKFDALCRDVCERSVAGQPVLVGAPTVADAEHISAALADVGVDHAVLSARYPEQEADIIAQAGRPGAVTVATNMAGRGVDIVLGGDADRYAAMSGTDLAEVSAQFTRDREAVIAAGGLAVLSTARHSSRRVDDQLRGRSGRQGEPGYSRFYLSLDDDLLTIFTNPTTRSLIAHAAADPQEPISHKTVSRFVASAQDRLENIHREARRSTNQYAVAINEQQRAVYQWRDALMSADPAEAIIAILRPAFRTLFDSPNPDELRTILTYEEDTARPVAADEDYATFLAFGAEEQIDWLDDDVVRACTDTPVSRDEFLARRCWEAFCARNGSVASAEELAPPMRAMCTSRLDTMWTNHLAIVDAVQDAAKLRSMGQRDPHREFVAESTRLFEEGVFEFFHGCGRLLSCGVLSPTPPSATVEDAAPLTTPATPA